MALGRVRERLHHVRVLALVKLEDLEASGTTRARTSSLKRSPYPPPESILPSLCRQHKPRWHGLAPPFVAPPPPPARALRAHFALTVLRHLPFPKWFRRRCHYRIDEDQRAYVENIRPVQGARGQRREASGRGTADSAGDGRSTSTREGDKASASKSAGDLAIIQIDMARMPCCSRTYMHGIVHVLSELAWAALF